MGGAGAGSGSGAILAGCATALDGKDADWAGRTGDAAISGSGVARLVREVEGRSRLGRFNPRFEAPVLPKESDPRSRPLLKLLSWLRLAVELAGNVDRASFDSAPEKSVDWDGRSVLAVEEKEKSLKKLLIESVRLTSSSRELKRVEMSGKCASRKKRYIMSGMENRLGQAGAYAFYVATLFRKSRHCPPLSLSGRAGTGRRTGHVGRKPHHGVSRRSISA